MTDSIEIRELLAWDSADYPAFRQLMHQLDPLYTVTEDMLRAVVEAEGSHLFVIREAGRILGCATLCVYDSPTGRKAAIEDVVVLEACRGRHLGRRLMEALLEEAGRYAPIEIHLTSRPSREAANALYTRLGFVRRDTNAYKLVLEKQ